MYTYVYVHVSTSDLWILSIVFLSFSLEYIRNKIMADSSTIAHSIYQDFSHDIQQIIEPTAINEIDLTHYDSMGAVFFIVIVLLWFSISIVCMLGIRIPARSETIDDCARRRAKFFLQTLHDQTETKQILGRIIFDKRKSKEMNYVFGFYRRTS